MHPLYLKASSLTEQVIGAAIAVHRDKGPGLLESIYEWCMTIELTSRGLNWSQQQSVTIEYKGHTKEEQLRFDLLVNSCLLLEIKSVTEVTPRHKAQLLSYMKLLNIPVGLSINFNEVLAVDGISRLMLPGADSR